MGRETTAEALADRFKRLGQSAQPVIARWRREVADEQAAEGRRLRREAEQLQREIGAAIDERRT